MRLRLSLSLSLSLSLRLRLRLRLELTHPVSLVHVPAGLDQRPQAGQVTVLGSIVHFYAITVVDKKEKEKGNQLLAHSH